MHHKFEGDHASNEKIIDSEGAPATLKPDLDAKLFEEPEALDFNPDDFLDDLFNDPPARDLDPLPETPTAQPQSPAMDANETAVAGIIDMGDAESSMIDSLKVAVVVPKHARKKVDIH